MYVGSGLDHILRDAALSSQNGLPGNCRSAPLLMAKAAADSGICFFDIPQFKYQFYNKPSLCQIFAAPVLQTSRSFGLKAG
jgi:hypothetical protein